MRPCCRTCGAVHVRCCASGEFHTPKQWLVCVCVGCLVLLGLFFRICVTQTQWPHVSDLRLSALWHQIAHACGAEFNNGSE